VRGWEKGLGGGQEEKGRENERNAKEREEDSRANGWGKKRGRERKSVSERGMR
jgi:hypothetical protein